MDASADQRDSVDVLIVGAGVSGIGAAYYLQRDHPGRSYAILEARGASGGTWDLFRYPGVRSDSDLHTFGYEFRPWRSEVAIADGDSILAYLRETAAEYGIDRHIRYHTKVVAAAWSSAGRALDRDVENTETGEQAPSPAGGCFCAAGYYRYDEGFTPDFAGRERFGGPVVHPQQWPEDLDYAGKRVVVIGSGATAVTLIPAMAPAAAHVTMLQRTPSYVLPVPTRDKLNARLTALLGDERAYAITRRMNIARQVAIWRFCQKYPQRGAQGDQGPQRQACCPTGYPVDEHFNPPYDPWDQRMCIVPDGDLFRVIRDGKASVVTGHIETFTENGVLLKDGRELPADIIVTATGLNVQALGGITLTVDGEPVQRGRPVRLQGHDAVRRAELRVRVRLHQRVLDAEGRPGVRALHPPAALHGRPRLRHRPAGRRRRRHAGRGRSPTSPPGTSSARSTSSPARAAAPPWRISPTYSADVKLLRRGRSTTRNCLRFDRRPGGSSAGSTRVRRGRVMDDALRAELLRRVEKDQVARKATGLGRDAGRWTRENLPWLKRRDRRARLAGRVPGRRRRGARGVAARPARGRRSRVPAALPRPADRRGRGGRGDARASSAYLTDRVLLPRASRRCTAPR